MTKADVFLFCNALPTSIFSSGDTITIVIKLPSPMAIRIRIEDAHGKSRYFAFRHGQSITLSKQFKYSRRFGTWKIFVKDALTHEILFICPFLMVPPDQKSHLRHLEALYRTARSKILSLFQSAPPQLPLAPSSSSLSLPQSATPVLPPRSHSLLTPLPKSYSLPSLIDMPLVVGPLPPSTIPSLPTVPPSPTIPPSLPSEATQPPISSLSRTSHDKAHALSSLPTSASEISPPSEENPILVTAVKGIGKTYAERLANANIFTVSQLLAHSPEHLSQITRAPLSRCKRWLTHAQELGATPISPVESTVSPPSVPSSSLSSSSSSVSPQAQWDPTDLTQIKGIGPSYARKLKQQGITTIDHLANSNPEQLATKLSFSVKRVTKWIHEAQQLLQSSSLAPLPSPGPAPSVPPSSDQGLRQYTNLEDVKGIGPATAKKLMKVEIGSPLDLIQSPSNLLMALTPGKARKLWINTALFLYTINPTEFLDFLSSLPQLSSYPSRHLLSSSSSLSDPPAFFAEVAEYLFQSILSSPSSPVSSPPSSSSPSPSSLKLTDIKGIGPKYAALLTAQSISSPSQLLSLTAEQLAQILHTSVKRASSILFATKSLLSSS